MFMIKSSIFLERLEHQSNIDLKWFEDKNMKINSGKGHLFVSDKKHLQMWAKIGDDKIWESKTIMLFGITIENELKFDEHISNVCMKAQRKHTMLRKIRKYLAFDKLQILFKTFFKP